MKKSEIVQGLEEAKFYFLNQNYEEAEKLFQKLLKVAPKNVEVLFHFGLLYEVTNQWEKAQKLFDKVLEINSNHKEAREHLDKISEI